MNRRDRRIVGSHTKESLASFDVAANKVADCASEDLRKSVSEISPENLALIRARHQNAYLAGVERVVTKDLMQLVTEEARTRVSSIVDDQIRERMDVIASSIRSRVDERLEVEVSSLVSAKVAKAVRSVKLSR